MTNEIINYEEYIMLKNINQEEYQKIARDIDGNLFIYSDGNLGEDYIEEAEFKVYSHLFMFIKGGYNYLNIDSLIDEYEKLHEVGKYKVNSAQETLFEGEFDRKVNKYYENK